MYLNLKKVQGLKWFLLFAIYGNMNWSRQKYWCSELNVMLIWFVSVTLKRNFQYTWFNIKMLTFSIGHKSWCTHKSNWTNGYKFIVAYRKHKICFFREVLCILKNNIFFPADVTCYGVYYKQQGHCLIQLVYLLLKYMTRKILFIFTEST